MCLTSIVTGDDVVPPDQPVTPSTWSIYGLPKATRGRGSN